MEILSLPEPSFINELPILWNGPEDAKSLVILAHGAGAPMDTEFMNYFAEELSLSGARVLRFEFPYMALRREGYGKRPPNGKKILFEAWGTIIKAVRNSFKGAIYIGGKSMGGRLATMIADEYHVGGVICLGYPFYAPGKQDKPRTEHLENLKASTLILQGERDSMGSKEVVSGYSLSGKVKIHWLPDGDHGLKPRKKSGFTERDNLNLAVKLISDFIS
ncbi:MAG: hypothetical protein P8H03_04150 [Emcibacteraceae bacterium]|nr:hypothetical protein [Emcibacteraceae bacterium]MDG1995844.1 hypothetical protein [Emcibacteraceae bacterium]